MRLFTLTFAALVRRQGETAKMCDPNGGLKPFCAAFYRHNGDGLQRMLTLSNEETERFHADADLPWPASYTCEVLCEHTLAFAKKHGVEAAPRPNVACFDPGCNDLMSLDPGQIALEAADGVKSEEARAARLARAGDRDDEADEVVLPAEDTEMPATEDADLTFTPRELARQLLVLMGTFPADLGDDSMATASLLEAAEVTSGGADPTFGPMVTDEHKAKYKKFVAHSAAILAAAVRRVEYNPAVVKKWLGEDVVLLEMFDVKRTFQKMLKTILNLKIKVGVNCGSPWTMAYVTTWRRVPSNYFIRSEKDWMGNYVVNMCEHYWEQLCWLCPDEGNRVSYGTLIHEAAHHHGATDVKLKWTGKIAYGIENNLRLVREQNSYGDHTPQQGAMNNADNLMSAVLALAQDLVDDAPLPPPPSKSSNGWLKAGTCSTECGAKEYDPGWKKGPLAIPGTTEADTLKENECARCRWTFRERWTLGLGGCHDGFSLGKAGKKLFKKICCHKETCYASVPLKPDPVVTNSETPFQPAGGWGGDAWR